MKNRMLTCKEFKLLGIILVTLFFLFNIIIDFFSKDPSYAATILTSVEVLVVFLLVTYFYCKKKS